MHWGYDGYDVLWMRAYADDMFFGVLAVAWRDMGLGTLRDVAGKGARVPPPVVGARLEKNLRLALAALAPGGAPYVFALQPTMTVTRKALSARETAEAERLAKEQPERAQYFRDCYAEIQRRAAALPAAGLRYLDLTGVFDADGAGEEIFLDSYHFGDRGNRRIAQALFGRNPPDLAGARTGPGPRAALTRRRRPTPACGSR